MCMLMVNGIPRACMKGRISRTKVSKVIAKRKFTAANESRKCQKN